MLISELSVAVRTRLVVWLVLYLYAGDVADDVEHERFISNEAIYASHDHPLLEVLDGPLD